MCNCLFISNNDKKMCTPKLTSTVDMYICITCMYLSCKEWSKGGSSSSGGTGVSGGATAGIVTAVIDFSRGFWYGT